MEGEAPTKAVLAVLSALNGALATRSPEALKSCFFPGQALWRDQLALTYHIRTFASADSIVASLLETQKLRGLAAGFKLSGAAHFIPATPFLVSGPRTQLFPYARVGALTICCSVPSAIHRLRPCLPDWLARGRVSWLPEALARQDKKRGWN